MFDAELPLLNGSSLQPASSGLEEHALNSRHTNAGVNNPLNLRIGQSLFVKNNMKDL
ncbi:hypothetical protein THF1A12_40197 [Vibrio jasicida]|uniref:Uncharacterized protein n=1 Tax=Vibrio jasicida TaxID=766224 RepID=A0AAU9QUP5_9VIBR|nr:hypothetical protein THF1A12_40197 [Vibrio jasicida]